MKRGDYYAIIGMLWVIVGNTTKLGSIAEMIFMLIALLFGCVALYKNVKSK